MRIPTLSILIVTFASLLNTAAAKDDFSALLADLSFGDEPKVSAEENSVFRGTPRPSETLGVVADQMAQELRPAPRGLAMPDVQDAKSIVSLHDPIPAMIDADQEVDFNAAFNLEEMKPATSAVQALPAGFGQHLGHSAAVNGCDAVGYCVPRTQPNLPSSSLHEYFRSNRCHTNVWDGYQQNCSSMHSHAHGTCDCFNKKGGCGQVLSCEGCGSCDGGCDR